MQKRKPIYTFEEMKAMLRAHGRTILHNYQMAELRKTPMTELRKPPQSETFEELHAA